MKTKRTVTNDVLKANQSNARKSAGPRDTTRTARNARTHGLLAQYLVFDDVEEESAFQSLLARLMLDRRPVGCLEAALIDEIAVCLWKMSKANQLEQVEMSNRRKASRSILDSVVAHSEQEPLPLFQRDDGTMSAARCGWECEELVVHTGTRNSRIETGHEGTINSTGNANTTGRSNFQKATGHEHAKNTAGQVHIEARLTNSIDSLLRYTASIKRDFYRAIRALHEMQRERVERSADSGAQA